MHTEAGGFSAHLTACVMCLSGGPMVEVVVGGFHVNRQWQGCSNPAVCEISRVTHMHKISTTDLLLNTEGILKTLSCTSHPEKHSFQTELQQYEAVYLY